ncbi:MULTISPECIES: porin [unclassified Delftia]|uniref:porin n=1 Tax=unclassified Delftia TaxID=2613839 RepID=UPI001901C4A4|nr:MULTISPECIES: porin [unclassified Delftia]MBK0114055.1 porin [Delftia sp. S65]MBK0117863.1 porin [Delftia sp. S67]MBK0129138.1 porin [Delftia sp. S66]
MIKSKVLYFSAAFLGASAAHAQSVQIYGLVDMGIERVSNVGVGRTSVTRMPGIAGSLPSRLGFRGTEDLGGNLKALFVLESGFSLDQGTLNQGGRMFGRQAYMGLQGSWGTLTLGRQYSPMYLVGIGDNLGGNIYSAGLLDSYLPNARLDNSISYKVTAGAFSFTSILSLGRDSVGGCPGELAGDSKACRTASAMVQYIQPSWGLAFATERQWGGPGTALPNSGLRDTRHYISGFYKFGDFKLGGGYLHRNNEGAASPRSDFMNIGATYTTGPVVLDVQYGRLNVKESSNDAQMVAIRALYNLSKRTATYVTAGKMYNKGASTFTIDGGVVAGSSPAPGVDQTGIMVGIRHAF